jgi:hypothetical protein
MGYIGTGQACGNARLRDGQAREVRELRALGWSQSDLALLFGVSRVTILGIIKGKTYPEAGGPVDPARYARRNRSMLRGALAPAKE